jgi:hypothetical protein
MRLCLYFAVLQYCAVHVFSCSLQSHRAACEQNQLLKKVKSSLRKRLRSGIMTEELRSQVELDVSKIQICLMRQVSGGICIAAVTRALSMKALLARWNCREAWDTLP